LRARGHVNRIVKRERRIHVKLEQVERIERINKSVALLLRFRRNVERNCHILFFCFSGKQRKVFGEIEQQHVAKRAALIDNTTHKSRLNNNDEIHLFWAQPAKTKHTHVSDQNAHFFSQARRETSKKIWRTKQKKKKGKKRQETNMLTMSSVVVFET
jgi:hypothetical protein